MFEEIIVQLDQTGVAYTEDYDMGTLTVDVAAIDKVGLINVIQMVTDSGLEFSIDEASLVIQGGAMEPELPPEEGTDEGLDMAAMQAGAMDEMF